MFWRGRAATRNCQCSICANLCRISNMAPFPGNKHHWWLFQKRQTEVNNGSAWPPRSASTQAGSISDCIKHSQKQCWYSLKTKMNDRIVDAAVGLQSRRLVQWPVLTVHHCQDRVQWAQTHINCLHREGQRVIFTDAKQTLCGCNWWPHMNL